MNNLIYNFKIFPKGKDKKGEFIFINSKVELSKETIEDFKKNLEKQFKHVEYLYSSIIC